MVVEARDLPSARLRRWGGLAAGGLAVLACAVWAFQSWGGARQASRALAEWEHRLSEHQGRADTLARECGIPPFSDEKSLEHFPMTLSDFPTKKQRECARDVGVARADLIDDHLKLHDMRPALVEARAASGRSSLAAVVLAAAWLGALYLLEIRPRQSRSAR